MKTIPSILICGVLALSPIVEVMAKESKQDSANGMRLNTTYMQLNPKLMRVYHLLDSVFPYRYLANESPADCGYWVNYRFASAEEYNTYKPWLESLFSKLQTVQAYTTKIQLTDSANTNIKAIEMSCTTPNAIQKDHCTFYISNSRVGFYYNAHIDGEEFRYRSNADDPNGQPRQDIADSMDALLDKYIKRKNVRVEDVAYDDSKHGYGFVSFISNGKSVASGYRYIVPNCTWADYQKFKDAIRSYSLVNPVRTSCNDVYWQYDASAICIMRPNGQAPLMIAAELKGTDLYLVRVEGEKNCILPRAWAEDDQKWETKEIYKLKARKPLAPPAVAE